MVAQVLSNTWSVVDDLDSEIAQGRSGSDSRQHEDMWRSDRPGTQDYLLALGDELLAAALHLDSGCTVAVEDDSMGGAIRTYRQVQPMPRHGEVPDVRAPADAVGIVERYRSDAGEVGVVMVRSVRVTRGPDGIVEGGLHGRVLVAIGEASTDDRALSAVEVTADSPCPSRAS